MDAKTLAIMDAMAEKIEALTARVEVAEKRLSEQCSCETWREKAEILGLTASFMDMHQ